MLRRIFILLVICSLVSSGCTTLKRYRSLSESITNDSLAGIDLFGIRLSQTDFTENGKSLWDLSADAQSQFIKILNSRYPDNDMFLNSLDFQFMKASREGLSENWTDKDLRLIFSISKKRSHNIMSSPSGIRISPADRIEYLRISLKLKEDSIIWFKGWNMYATEYGLVDIADVSFSRNLEFKANTTFSSENSNISGEGFAGATSTISRREDQNLKYRYLKLNGKINPEKIEMEEEGTREIDLTGNIIADVSIVFFTIPETLTQITGFKDSTGVFNDPEKAGIRYTLASVPYMKEIKDTIYADLEMDYVYRNVIRGSKTFPEWDDRIKYVTGRVRKAIPLFAMQDYVPDIYCIGMPDDGKERDILKVRSSSGKLYELKFKTFSEATSFSDWLIDLPDKNENPEKIIRIGGQTVVFKGRDLTYGQLTAGERFRVLSYYY